MTSTLTKKRYVEPGRTAANRDKSRPTIRKLRDRLGMSQRVFARLMCVSERSLAKYEKEDAYGDPIQRQISSLSRLESALAGVIKPESIGKWFQEPNPAFDGLKPLEVVERGEIDRLWAMVYELESGTAS